MVREKSKEFKKNVTRALLTKVLLICLKVGLSVVTARTLGASGRGIFFSVAQFAGTYNTIGTLSIGEAFIYFVGCKQILREKVFWTASVVIAIFIALLTAMLWVCFLFFKETVGDLVPLEYFTIILLLLPCMMSEYILASAIKSLREYDLANKLSLFSRIFILLLVLISVTLVSTDVLTCLKAYTLAVFASTIMHFFALASVSSVVGGVAWGQIKPLITYGSSLHLGTLITEVEYRADIFILLYFMSVASVGIYSIGVALAQIIWFVSNSVNSILFPTLMNSQKEGRPAFTAKVIRITLLINLNVAVILTIIGYPLTLALYGHEFAQSYLVFLVLLPGILFDCVGRGLITLLKSENWTLDISAIATFSLLVNLSLNVLLIPRFGIFGAAMASSLSYALRAIVLAHMCSKKTALSLNSMIITSAEIKAFYRECWSLLLTKISLGRSS